MNTTTPNGSGAAGLPRAVWIGGSLMALAIIALATTLITKSGDSVADNAATPQASTTATADAASAADTTTPAMTSAKATHHAGATAHHEAGRDDASTSAQQVAAAPECAHCGVIDGYSVVQVHGQNNGVGAVAGGLGGALVGSQIAGRGNHTLGGVIGAVGGGLLGNAIETHQRTTTAYDVRVRMTDGTIRTVRQSTVPTVGQHVDVEGNTLHAIASQG